jgi:hypothetical protein
MGSNAPVSIRRAIMPAVLATLVLCGCGGSSLSMAQLRSDANRFCTDASQQTDRIPTPTSPTGGAAFLKRGDAAIATELRRLRMLRPPSDAADVYSSALDVSSAELASLRTTVGQLDRGGDPAGTITSLQHRLRHMESRANAAWHSLAISACVDR